MGMSYTRQEIEEARGDGRPWRDVLWLAGHDVRRTWPSYPGSAAYMAFLGLFFGLPNAPGPGTFSFEFIMFSVGLILATPFFAREYMSWSTDPIAERLAWLRMLPIGVPTIVRARALAFFVALPLNAIAFFGPAWLGGRWGMSAGAFFWFCLAIIGISIAAAGATLVLEMSVSIRRWITINIVSISLALAMILVIGFWLDVRVLQRISQAAEAQGPLTALISLVLGSSVFLWCIRLAEDGLRRRELMS